MKILYLLTQDLESPSGLGRYFPIAAEMARLGHEVWIAALHPDYSNLRERSFNLQGVHVRYVAPMHVQKLGNTKRYYPPFRLFFTVLRATWALSVAALSIPADIVHICKPHPMNGVAGLFARAFRRCKLYLDCDDYEAASSKFSTSFQRRLVTFFEDHLPRRVDFITTHASFLRERMIANGVAPGRILELSNGVDPLRFALPFEEEVADLKTRLGLAGRKVILYLGSLSTPSHPVELLMEAFRRLHETEPEVALLIVGGGADFDALKARAELLGLASSVYFTGRVPPEEARLYYSLANVSVDPVLDDGAARGRSPLKLFESLASGIPFVTADVGNRRELLGSPPAGVLVQPGSAEALCQALEAVLSDPFLAAELRTRGFVLVKNYYWGKLALKLNDFYTRTLSK